MPDDLTVAYFRKQPESAARALLRMPPADSAAALEGLPAAVAAQPLSLLGAWPASGIVARMTPESAGAVLGAMDDATAAAILRLTPPPGRRPLLEHLPARSRRQVEQVLNYPPDTVGAHVTTSIVVLGLDVEVSVALDAVRNAEHTASDTVFVINEKSEPAGAVSVAALLSCDVTAALAEIADSSLPILLARAGLAGIANIDAWHDHDALAVVNRRGQMIGVLTRRRLRQGVAGRPSAASPLDTSISGMLSDALLASAGGLFGLLAGRRSPPAESDGE